MRVPTQILNECLNRIVDLGFVRSVPPASGSDSSDVLYQPARPLNRITLLQVKAAADSHGADPASGGLDRVDPMVGEFEAALERVGHEAFFRKSVEELLSENQEGN